MARRSSLLDPQRLSELLLFRLARLVAAGGAQVIRLCEGQYNITRREWRLIAALSQHGTMLSSALADHIQLERGPTSKAVSDLVAKGLAVRRPRPNDRRQVDIELTPAAHAIYKALFPQVVQINKDLLAALSPAEVDTLDVGLARLQQRAQERLALAALPKADRRRRHKRAAPNGAAAELSGRPPPPAPPPQ
jgi:DNA-binding MarR family transcriptional regulator